MKKIEVRCPSCAGRGFIEVSEEKVGKVERGVFAVNVSEGIICEHSFVAYIDKNFMVRDTFITDFQLEVPDIIPKKSIEPKASAQLDSINVSLIKLNLSASLIAYIIRAILHKRKIVLIFDQLFMFDDVRRFFDYITRNSFETELVVISEDQYNSESYNDYIVFNRKDVIKDDDGIIDVKKLGVERALVQKFFEEYEPIPSLIYLQNGLQKAYELSETIADIVKGLKKKEQVYSKKIIKDLSKIHNVKIQLTYLNFLFKIVENYFKIEVPKSSKVSNFLGTL
ncbi:MAG: hypothetical protein CEE42_04095 [Promethearchaeota archaeon Loki_b31]|nr:MAG: hypothetical protein CEE42_04095 [Candidatus Lokiarchaeota archaeon Loki_b31]